MELIKTNKTDEKETVMAEPREEAQQQEAEAVSVEKEKDEEGIPYVGPARVLVVEDEYAICRAVTIALQRAGFDVTTAQTGEVATAMVQHRTFDLLMLDYRMPDMTGDTICHIAMSYQPHLRHRTLFVTGDITDKAIKAIEACKCPVLHKPFELAELIMFLREMYPQYMAVYAKK